MIDSIEGVMLMLNTIFNETQLIKWNFGAMELLRPNRKDYPGQHIKIKAESRGGDITIDVNEGGYIFIYLSA
jgi:hypothetical protein